MRDGVRADTFLLDTLSGDVWQLTALADVKDEPTAWMLMPRIDTRKKLDLKQP
jgi:hypothetical protein